MATKTQFQEIGDESVDLWERFYTVIGPYRHALWQYCRKLTGSSWDAEDLYQDTLLKSFASLSTLSHRLQPLKPKSFLFRVATNHWIDQCRRQRVLLDDDIMTNANVPLADSLEVQDAVELLIRYLPTRQAVVFVLMESFEFTAKETAELLSVTEGAVNAMLHRARSKLNGLRSLWKDESAPDELAPMGNGLPSRDLESIQLFIQAFNARDYRRLADLLIDEASFSFVASGSTEYGKGVITKYSLNPNKERNLPEGLSVRLQVLWNRPSLVFVLDTTDGPRLYDVNTIEWEEGKIARWKCYYFCREFMADAAAELGMSLQPLAAEFKN